MSTEKVGGAGGSAAAKSPAWMRELEALRAQRTPPGLDREYTPGGTTEQTVHHEVSEIRETRISILERRFGGMQGHAANEFGVSQQHGVPKRAFERSR